MRFHQFVQHDGPISIARAFNVDDGGVLPRPLTASTGVWRFFPFRLCVSAHEGPDDQAFSSLAVDLPEVLSQRISPRAGATSC